MKTKRIATYGLLISLAFVLSYLETLIPVAALGFFVPGMKIGLANIVVMVALYSLGARDAFILSMVRIFLVSLTFGNTVALAYSLSGGIMSYLVMLLLKKTNLFSITAVSISGGIFHNLGQVLMAAWILQTAGVLAELPLLFVSGAVTGVFIGFLGGQISTRIRRFLMLRE